MHCPSNLKRLSLLFLVASLCIAISHPHRCPARTFSSQALQHLSKNSKIISPEATLRKFSEGQETVSVIVRLQEQSGNTDSPGNVPSTQELATTSGRDRLRTRVKSLLERFLSKLDSTKARITNRFSYILGFAAEVSFEGMQDLVNRDEVLSVQENHVLHSHLAQGIPLINATSARSSYSGEGLSIAICDTGIDTSHPMLGGTSSFPNSKVIGGYDVGDGDSDPRPTPNTGNAHGTACAGIAAGDLGLVGDYIGGVAPGARLYAVKIATGDTGSATEANMIEGWEWCITHQLDNPNYPIIIISTSFGGDRAFRTCDSSVPAMTQAAANAVAAGITIFCSAGNDGYCDSISWPACISHVISVGGVYDAAVGDLAWCVSAYSCATTSSTTGCSTGWFASDSSAPDMVTSYSNTAGFLNLLAPSNQVYTTDIVGTGGYNRYGDYYSSFGGTSAASPYAAGAAAVLQCAAKSILHRFLTPQEIKDTLINTGDPVADAKVNITKPRINLGRALSSLLPSTDDSLSAIYPLLFDP